MNCSSCGRGVQPGQMFCPHCGLAFGTPVPGAQPQRQAPQKKGGPFGRIALGVVVLFVYYIGHAIVQANEDISKEGGVSISSPDAPASHTVTYAVSGSTSSASLTYENAEGGTVQKDVYLPWSETATFKSGSFISISAQNKQDHGSISTDITVDGNQFKHTTSDGEYVIAECNGECP